MLSRIPISYLLCFLIFAGGALCAHAQDTALQPSESSDAQQVELQRELEREKLRTQLAEQRRKTFAARLPESRDDAANKTLKGEISVEDKANTFETESVALSYEAISMIAGQIGAKLQTGAAEFNQLVIYSDQDFQTLIQYRVFASQAAPALSAYDFLLQTESQRLGDKSIGGEALLLPEMGTALVRSAIDFLSLFRTDTAITNKRVTIDETALGALVASEIRSQRPSLKVYFPKAYIPEDDWEPADQKSVLTQLSKLYTYHGVVRGILADYDQSAAAEKPKQMYHRKISTLRSLNEQVSKLLEHYENKQGESAGNRLRELVRAEQLSRMLDSDARTGILHLKVLDSGGSERLTRNLIFGSKIRHSGSAIVEYLLFDKTGALRSSEMFYYHTGFQKMNKVRGPKN